MIEHLHQHRERAVTLGYLAVGVLLLFQISLSAGVTGSPDRQEPAALTADEPAAPVLSENVGQAPAQQKVVTVYQVQPGDSLYWIAATYGLSVEELRELNNLDTDVIRVGQRLVVPLDTVKFYPAGVTLSSQEVEWLAQMIHAEARGEPYIGQVAVGAVIINRMLSPQFPNTLRGVLFQRNAFQPIQNGSFYMTPNESARKAALEALNGHDPTGGALFFFNPRQSNDRFMHSRPAKVTIGSHRFTM
ncbi:MAG: cell wall hydrolase [Bacillota bacterium]|jgi:N-acetylmuramoyl-L-alanine amidase|nr:cell wall hydrolase [Bacillota bacterium]NLJ02816.1 LysM peptidoglycan-binding domain-containing protein [Bacillota bacterium]